MSKEFWIGVGVLGIALLLAKPAKKLAVGLVGTAMILADKGKELAINVKEEVEDIIAEAQYQHTQSKIKTQPETADNPS